MPGRSESMAVEQANGKLANQSLRSAAGRCAELVDCFLSEAVEDVNKIRKSTQEQVKLSLKIINETFDKHKIEELALSFNGGKDCQVMLILFLAALHRRPDHLASLTRVPSVYVHFENSFTEVDQFVDHCKEEYCLEVVRLPPPLKDAFEHYLNHNAAIKAIFVGIRRTDPYGDKLTYYERTDHGWPDFIRVHPVLEWHFVEVWDFLRHTNVHYCPLYDQGYTSLGGTDNTRRNPRLLLNDERDVEGNAMYRPAYELTDDENERLSRVK